MSDESRQPAPSAETPDIDSAEGKERQTGERPNPWWQPSQADIYKITLFSMIAGSLAAISAVVELFTKSGIVTFAVSAGILLLAIAAVLVSRPSEARSKRLALLLEIGGAIVLAGVTAVGILVYAGQPSRSPSTPSAPPTSPSAPTSPASVINSPAGPASTSPSSGKTSPVVSPDTSPVTSSDNGTPPIRHQGTLVLLGNGQTSYDLDSTASDWGAADGSWQSQNVQYFPVNSNGVPMLDIANAPENDVLMGTAGHWTYQDCANARYIQSFAASNPNSPLDKALDPGHGICVLTFDTPAKTDGGHYALLVVLARTGTTLTLRITVWQ
jgi:hypothetical protein